MSPRRPAACLRRGVFASVVLTLLGPAALSACSPEKIEVKAPELSDADARACTTLVEALPDTLAGELRRPVDPEGAPGAAWGDPAYVLTCGVDRPGSYTRDAPCSVVRGVGWFVPAGQLGDLRVEATASALTHTPHVELLIPARHRNDGVDQALAELAPVIKEHLVAGEPCL